MGICRRGTGEVFASTCACGGGGPRFDKAAAELAVTHTKASEMQALRRLQERMHTHSFVQKKVEGGWKEVERHRSTASHTTSSRPRTTRPPRRQRRHSQTARRRASRKECLARLWRRRQRGRWRRGGRGRRRRRCKCRRPPGCTRCSRTRGRGSTSSHRRRGSRSSRASSRWRRQ